jgi:hypothetical protein
MKTQEETPYENASVNAPLEMSEISFFQKSTIFLIFLCDQQFWCRDIRHNDILENDTQHNN